MEKKNILREEAIVFALSVSDVCDGIRDCTVFKNQLIRAASSVGANLHEARYAQSRPDFISKLEIALKECYESEYWLELLWRKEKLTGEQYTQLKNKCGTIRRMLIASVTTAKENGRKQEQESGRSIYPSDSI